MNPTTIDHAEFVEKVADGSVAVIDVREPHEYAAGHVPGAINHPLSRFQPSAMPSGKPVVLICASGVRSMSALAKARAGGHESAVHYAPGTNGWRMRGGQVER